MPVLLVLFQEIEVRFIVNKILHTAYTGLPVFLRQMNFFGTAEKFWLHVSKLTWRILFYQWCYKFAKSVELYLNTSRASAIFIIIYIYGKQRLAHFYRLDLKCNCFYQQRQTLLLYLSEIIFKSFSRLQFFYNYLFLKPLTLLARIGNFRFRHVDVESQAM